MITSTISVLKASEYASYYGLYIQHVNHLSIKDALAFDWVSISNVFINLSEEKAFYAYAEGKWTIREVLLHCIDAERIFAYRALRFIRADGTDLPGYDHEAYVREAGVRIRSVESLHKEWESVRQSTLSLFENATPEELIRGGTANQNNVTARALAYIITGHNMHHVQILRERYGLNV